VLRRRAILDEPGPVVRRICSVAKNKAAPLSITIDATDRLSSENTCNSSTEWHQKEERIIDRSVLALRAGGRANMDTCRRPTNALVILQ